MNSLELWYGRAGQGKSSRILSEIEQLVRKEPFGSPIWWVVPPGASFATERRLVERLPAVMRVEVLTLDRLADRVLSLLMGQDPSLCEASSSQRLNPLGRRLLMFMVYDAHRAELSLLYRERASLPFIDSLLLAIDELKDHEITRDAVAKPGKQQTPKREYEPATIAFEKVKELLLLQDAYQGAIEDQGLWDQRQTLHVLQEALSKLDVLRETVLFFDGFWQWTPLEARFVAGLSQVARKSVVAVPLGEIVDWTEEGDLGRATSLFNPGGYRMVHHLKKVCREMSLSVIDCETMVNHPRNAAPNRFHGSPCLTHLESQLFREVPEPYAGKVGEEVRVIAAQNERVEMMGVAEEIRKLVLVDNMEYRDMMILTPYADESLSNLRDILEDMNIPYVMDEFPMFSEHPLARFLLSALDAGEHGVTADNAISLLKSEFPSMSRGDADWLLDYARRHEVDDEDWSNPKAWKFATQRAGIGSRKATEPRLTSEDARADGLRQRLIGNFTSFVLRLKTSEVNMKDLAFALWELLENVDARSQVAQWMVNEDATLSPLEASLHEQAWEFVMDLLDDSMVLHGFLTLPTPAAIALLRIAISDHVLSTIPGKMDAVLVTDPSRAQGCEADVVFVLGACDGMFPNRVRPSGLFLDEEREAFFAATQKRLGITTEERQWDARYDIYQALTRAKRRLYLTYPLSGRDGKAQRPANLVGEVKAMFANSDMREELWTTRIGDFTDTEIGLWSPDRALRYVSGFLRRPAWDESQGDGFLMNRALMRWIEGDEQLSRRLSTMVKGLSHEPSAPQLIPETARSLFRGPTSVNVSQLETYAACPFRHFALYGLRLRREELGAGMKAFMGTIVHNGLQSFVERMMSDPEAWRRADDETVERIMDSVFDEMHGGDSLAPWRRKAVREEAIQSVRQLLQQAARVLTLQVRRGRYQPRVVELAFEAPLSEVLRGLYEGQSQADELRVVGRIDRVDVASDQGRFAFRIFDYKSSPKTLDPARVLNGLQLQLPVYGAVIQSLSQTLLGRESELAAILYSPIVRRVQKVTSPDEGKANRDAISGMKAAGLFVCDRQFIEWMDDALTGSAEDSPLFPKIYNRNGEVSKGAPVLSLPLWNALLKNVLTQVVDMSKEIANGHIDIAPYRLKRRETACQQCEFSSLCHVEPRRNPQVFRELASTASFAESLSLEEGGREND